MPSLLLKGTLLVAMVVVMDVEVKVVVGVTVPIFGSNETSADGIDKRNGSWMMNCKSCGWNDTHTSGYHGEWTCNQSAFKLPATHVFWSKSGSAPSAEEGSPPAPSTDTSGVSKGQLSELIS